MRWFKNLLALPNDNTKKTVLVALLLCLVCAVLVSSAAVVFKPLQIANKALDKKKNILEVSGLLTADANMDALFEKFEVKVVDLATGEYVDIDPALYDQRKAAGDITQNITLTAAQDIAGIGHRAKLATVYLLKEDDEIKQIVLPVHGYGLWSTLYGFISLQGDANTIQGLKFYEHAETPGLGGEVDNPKWRSQWLGKKAFDEAGELQIEVVRGKVNFEKAEAIHQIDGLSGATLTSVGVSNLVKYWLGEHGFAAYLDKLRTGELSHGE
jgi:Na+-transporting NADH:ubiquinone oxidoreductase subunit C